MTKKQQDIAKNYIEKLADIKDKYGDDPERAHAYADEEVLNALYELGFQDIVEAYKKVSKIGFWYA